MKIDDQLKASALTPALQKFWALSGQKIDSIFNTYDPAKGSPVFTVAGKYTARGWTEWTEGFSYGSGFLQFDATGEQRFADAAAKLTVDRMASHVSHVGVHDDGFNNLSTYGNWLRLQGEGKLKLSLPHEECVLEPGQCMQFDAIQQHGYEALADSEFVILHLRKDKRY